MSSHGQQTRHSYGGQAVIEGVMIRGMDHFGLAVRRPDGTIFQEHQRLNSLYTGPVRRVPFVRGVLVLLESLVLGVKALQRSANVAAAEPQAEVPQEISPWIMAATLTFSLALGIGLFFLLPLLIVDWGLDRWIESDYVSNVLVGLVRLLILLGYIGAMGLSRDLRRVFAYHGAEHMAVHTHEAGLPLEVANVRKFPTPHPRCGTAFLLTVVLVSVIVFAFLGRPSIEWRILSHLALIPVIAGMSYEIIRLSGKLQGTLAGKWLAAPGLLLQRMTTRQPDDDQIEVAICAMELAIAADSGRAALTIDP